jgi:hypothetical protein
MVIQLLVAEDEIQGINGYGLLAFKEKGIIADYNAVAMGQLGFANGVVVDRGAVDAPQIFDAVGVTFYGNLGVATGNGGIRQVDIVEDSPEGIVPPYQSLFSRQVEDLLFSFMSFYYQSDHLASPALGPSAFSPSAPNPTLFSI